MSTPRKSHKQTPRHYRSEIKDPISTEQPSQFVHSWPWTWRSIREYMSDKYGNHYTAHELRTMEVKWRRVLADAGWSVKGQ